MIRKLSLLSVLTVAACGVDGDPLPPDDSVYPYTHISVGVGSNGNVGGAIGVSRGPLSVGASIF